MEEILQELKQKLTRPPVYFKFFDLVGHWLESCFFQNILINRHIFLIGPNLLTRKSIKMSLILVSMTFNAVKHLDLIGFESRTFRTNKKNIYWQPSFKIILLHPLVNWSADQGVRVFLDQCWTPLSELPFFYKNQYFTLEELKFFTLFCTTKN